MNVFDLSAILRLDRSEYDKGLDDAEKKANSSGGKIKDALGTAGKVAAAVGGAFLAFGKGALSAFDEVDSGADIIVKKTGATGEAAEALEKVYKNVAGSVVGSFDEIGAAVGELNTRWGATGDELEDLSKEFVRFAKINDTSVEASVASVDKAMKTFNVDSSQTKNVLGLLTKVGQDTGISVSTLSGLLQSSGASLQTMGLNLTESVMLMGQFEKAGIESSTMLAGMQRAATNFSKEGKDMRTGLDDLIERLQNSETEAEATAEAYEIFGTRSGLSFVNFAKQGKISLKKLSANLEDYSDVVGKTYDETIDASDEMAVAWKQIKMALGELGKAISKALLPVIKKLQPKIQELAKWFSSLSEEQVETALKIAGVVTAAGVLISVLTKVSGAVSSLFTMLAAHPIMAIVTAIGLLVGGIAGWIVANQDAKQSIYALSEEEQAYLDKIHEEKTAWEEAHTARQEALTNNVAEIEQAQSLWDELKKITDENGNIKQGYEDRAAVITGILSEALGEEITIVDGQIQKYDELKESVDEVIRKKKLSALLAAGEDAYSEALINQRTQFDKVTEARNRVTAAEKDEKKAAEDLAKAQAKYDEILRTQGKHAAEVYKPTVDNLTKAHDDAKNKLDEMTAALETENAKYGDYVGTIQTYEDLVAASTSDSVEAIDSASTKFVDHVNKSEEELSKLGRNARAWGKDMMMNFAAGIGDKGYEVEKAVKKVTKMVNRNLGFSEPEEGYLSNFHTYAPDMMKLWAKGIKDNAWRVMDEVESVTGGISSGVSGIEAQSGDSSMGGASININVYGAEGQDVEKLADKVSEKIAMQYNRLRMAY